MDYKYYNIDELLQISNQIKYDPIDTKRKLIKYLNKFPTDYMAYTYYIHVLIILSEIEKAEEILDFVEKNYDSDKRFASDYKRKDKIKYSILLSKLRILGNKEDYEKLYKCFLENKELMTNFYELLMYCKKKLNLITEEDKQVNSYYIQQIIEYNEDEFKKNIDKYLIDNISENIDNKKWVFSSYFNTAEVIEEVRKYIPSDKKLCLGINKDTYVFRYDKCGTVNDKLTNYFKVVSFHNTSDLINMFPSDACEKLPYIDLNYLKPKLKDNKAKRLSQIDKFNQRYNIN